jgi:hypothetical protein
MYAPEKIKLPDDIASFMNFLSECILAANHFQ